MVDEALEQALGEAKKAAKDLAQASARLTRRLLRKAERVAKDPRGSATRAAKTTAKELKSVAHEVDQILKKL
jgi:hypothetical protein